MKLIRILHVVGAMDRGGAEVLLMKLYENIDRDKVQFDFLVHTHKHSLFDKEILALGGKVYKLENTFFKNTLRYLRELYLFFKNHPEYDCVHSHMNNMSGYILWMAKKANIKFRIAHSHVSFPNVDLFRGLVWRIGRKLILTNADCVFGCSSEAVVYLTKRIPDGKKRIVLQNAIDINFFNFNNQERDFIRKKINVGKETFIVGNIGRFEKVKNHLFLIEVFNKLLKLKNNAVLVLIGTGSLLPEIQKKVKELNIDKNVKFLGDRSDVPSLLNVMDVFFMPSLYEGLGIVLIEAQANGLPCVASDTIPKEADINAGLINFLSLDIDKSKWRDTILNANRNNNIKDPQIAAKEAGYDIKEVSMWLQNYYLNKQTLS